MEVQRGPNTGKEFPSLKAVENFNYNGFMTIPLEGFASYEVEEFIEWTNDPGIGRFKCSNGEIKLIPSCQLTREYVKSLPEPPELKPLEGIGVLFGEPSHS